MLTKLEVDGFKNLLGFSIEFGPYSCIAGPNGVGKSNIFDAIRLLSLLADYPIIEAFLKIRGSDESVTDPRELFWTDGENRSNVLTLSAEMIVDQKVRDDFGRQAEASSTYLRYEVKIGYETPYSDGELGRLVLRHESLEYITETNAVKRIYFPYSAEKFRKSAVVNKRRARSSYISTTSDSDGQSIILVHQDGGSRGPQQRAPAANAPRTIIATANTISTPTILAARREMQNWKILALEPTAMRKSDRFLDDSHITSSGGHLPATLHRLEQAKNEKNVVSARIASKLSEFVPITSVTVDKDDIRQLLILKVRENTGVTLPSRSLSDGTLRFLTLCIFSEDPEARGVICMEEPENGIHPAKIEAMVNLLRGLAVDTNQEVNSENIMRQVIVATHSPTFVQLQNKDDLLFASNAVVIGPFKKAATTLRCLPIINSWRAQRHENPASLGTLLAYLTTPPGAQIKIDIP